jgi:hypothetical protein
MCAAILIPLGFFGTLVGVWIADSVIADWVPERLGAWLFWHYEVIYLFALACGLALAASVDRASRSRRDARAR